MISIMLGTQASFNVLRACVDTLSAPSWVDHSPYHNDV